MIIVVYTAGGWSYRRTYLAQPQRYMKDLHSTYRPFHPRISVSAYPPFFPSTFFFQVRQATGTVANARHLDS